MVSNGIERERDIFKHFGLISSLFFFFLSFDFNVQLFYFISHFLCVCVCFSHINSSMAGERKSDKRIKDNGNFWWIKWTKSVRIIRFQWFPWCLCAETFQKVVCMKYNRSMSNKHIRIYFIKCYKLFIQNITHTHAHTNTDKEKRGQDFIIVSHLANSSPI